MSRKFHYSIDTDLPPSQLSLVLYVSTFLSHLFFSSGFLCSSLMAAAGISSLAEEIIVLLQMEGKGLILIFPCGREEVGCRVSDPIQSVRLKIG